MEQSERFKQTSLYSIAKVLKTANPEISSHPVNKGITESRASCFSFLSADLMVAEIEEVFIHERNQFPLAIENKDSHKSILSQAYRDLFHTIGLDQSHIPVEERRDELSNFGGWIPLHN
jgi:hypothetical protein